MSKKEGMDLELFDTHAHYNDEKFSIDRESVIEAVYNSGVTKLVNAGYSLESSKRALEIAEKYSWMYAICGVSPNDIPEEKEEIDRQVEELKKLISCKQRTKMVESVDRIIESSKEDANNSRKIVAIGEIGLDY